MAAGNIQNLAGFDNAIDLAIIDNKVLDILRNKTIGSYAAAIIENPAQLDAGTVVYRVPELLKTKKYKRTGNDSQIPNFGTVSVHVDQYVMAKWELEDFDKKALFSNLRDQMLATIANGLALSIDATLDLVFFNHVAKIANKNTYVPLTDALSTDATKIRDTRLKILDEAVDLTTAITKTQVGTDEDDVLIFASPKLYTRLAEGVSSVGGDNAINIKVSGNIPGQRIGGFNILRHSFLGKDFEPSLFCEEAKAAEFTPEDTIAFVVNRQAIAFPIDLNVKTTVATSPDTGNDIFIKKLRYGIGTLRENLVKGIKKA